MNIQAIEVENSKNLKSFVMTLGSYYTISLYFFFSIVDYVFYDDYFLEFFGVRALVVLSILGIVRILKKSEGKPALYIQIVCSIPFGVCAISIDYMLLRIGDPFTAYWAGLAIVTAGLSVGFTFSWRFYLMNIAFIALGPLCISLYHFSHKPDQNYFLNLIFLLSITTVCITGRWFYLKLSISEYNNRKQLAEEVESRNKIIEVKTQETVRLNSLSKQFSPQIIQSIQSGKISLSSKIHRSEICAIFVDIKDSTIKFSTLDRDNLQKIISIYMEDVMGIFLKFDITIDKFLGDGVMGFTNDPVTQSDYIERAIAAAGELINRINLKSGVYNSLWGSAFEVRIGISSGVASVGFYGSDLHVKSYTAIGRVINLASRVNGIAPPNQIAISGDVLAKIKEKNDGFLRDFEVRNIGFQELKGFEKESIDIFTIEQSVANSEIGDDENCPHGHGPLMIAQLNNGIYAMKCRYCDYVLDETIPKLKVA